MVSRFDPACLCKLCMSFVEIFVWRNTFIRKYFCFYFYLSSLKKKLLLLFTQVIVFTNSETTFTFTQVVLRAITFAFTQVPKKVTRLNTDYNPPIKQFKTSHALIRASSYVRKESPILSLSWWGWGSCYESVVLGAPFTPAGITAEAERRVAHSIKENIYKECRLRGLSVTIDYVFRVCAR